MSAASDQAVCPRCGGTMVRVARPARPGSGGLGSRYGFIPWRRVPPAGLMSCLNVVACGEVARVGEVVGQMAVL